MSSLARPFNAEHRALIKRARHTPRRQKELRDYVTECLAVVARRKRRHRGRRRQ